MRTISLFILALMVLGCAQAPGHNSTLIPPKNAILKSIEGLGRYALGSPVQYRNVTVVPVMLTSVMPCGSVSVSETVPEVGCVPVFVTRIR